MFTLFATNYKIWNQTDLINYCVRNQNQHIEISTNNDGACLRTVGLYDILDKFTFKSVKIFTVNTLEKHNVYTIVVQKTWNHFFQYYDSSKFHSWNQNKIFGCFYNRPTWYRIGLAAELENEYANNSIINWKSSWQSTDQREFWEVDKLFYYAPDSFKKFSSIMNNWPSLQVPEYSIDFSETTADFTQQLESLYPNILIDIVAETWVAGRTFYLTEKTIRPMLLKKPMIVMGSRDTLDYLHQMGFKTFNDFWDEDYDGYAEGDRYNKILHLLKKLNNMSVAQLAQMYQEMQPILEHNLGLLENQNYVRKVHYIE